MAVRESEGSSQSHNLDLLAFNFAQMARSMDRCHAAAKEVT